MRYCVLQFARMDAPLGWAPAPDPHPSCLPSLPQICMNRKHKKVQGLFFNKTTLQVLHKLHTSHSQLLKTEVWPCDGCRGKEKITHIICHQHHFFY